MSQIGYFTEIEMLHNKIVELEQKLETERVEHKDIMIRMREKHAADISSILNELIDLRRSNQLLREELLQHQELP
jgi:hypothetical protein